MVGSCSIALGDDEDISLFDGMVVAGIQVMLDDVSFIMLFLIVGNAYRIKSCVDR